MFSIYENNLLLLFANYSNFLDILTHQLPSSSFFISHGELLKTQFPFTISNKCPKFVSHYKNFTNFLWLKIKMNFWLWKNLLSCSDITFLQCVFAYSAVFWTEFWKHCSDSWALGQNIDAGVSHYVTPVLLYLPLSLQTLFVLFLRRFPFILLTICRYWY